MRKHSICAIGLCGQSVFLGVDHFHAPGETIHADRIYTEPGGKAYNQAVAAARLGAPALFIGATGNDANGAACRSFLDQEGVSHRMMVNPDSATAYACILTDSEGENRVTVYRGASDDLSPEYIRSCREEIAACGMLLLSLETSFLASVAALEIAEEFNIPVILNPAPAQKLDPTLLCRFDLITPNRQEACILTGTASGNVTDLCLAFRDMGIHRAVVTMGSEGALLYTESTALLFPAIPSKAVDTTGAGDCFNAALAVALLSGQNPEDAVVYAINASALSVRRPHVMTALPTADEVLSSYVSVTPREISL